MRAGSGARRPATSIEGAPRKARSTSKRDSPPTEYFESLVAPTMAEIHEIAKIQARRESAVQQQYIADPNLEPTSNVDADRAQAAGKIQRVYRGHRARRAMEGLSLDPATRWDEVIRDAQFRHLNTPRPRASTGAKEGAEEDGDRPSSSSGDARGRWQRIGQITRHAHGHERTSDTESSSDEEEDVQSPIPKHVRAFHKRQERKEKEAWKGKMMDLPYFLEMVDVKHRYGSNLRAYHEQWKKEDTHENFFYWLDHGAGRHVEVPTVTRERLEREQVRYLSREERMQYLIKVDDQGKLRWAKNNEVIDTTEEYRDSVDGIVPRSSPNKTFRQDELESMRNGTAPAGSDSDSDDSSASSEGERRYPGPTDSKGHKKIVHVTPGVIMNRLMRKSVKKNTWIFVADRNWNIFVGIKQSGSFQHSSFIQGSRVAAAGLIKVKEGQLRSLAPLSGHYRPPTAAFRSFVEHLKASGVDMSRLSISKSYAVLVGLEMYRGGKEKAKKAQTQIAHGVQHIVKPKEAKERQEQELDKSESAELERATLRTEHEARPVGRVVKAARDKIGMEESPSHPPSGHASLPDRTRMQAA